MLFRKTVTLSSDSPFNCILELEGEDDTDEMTVVKVVKGGGPFVDRLIKVAIEKDTIPRYTGGGPYTEALTRIISTRETYDAKEEVMPDDVETQVAAAILELASDVIVTYHPALLFRVGCQLHFYFGSDVSPHSVQNFWVPTVVSIEADSEASLAA